MDKYNLDDTKSFPRQIKIRGSFHVLENTDMIYMRKIKQKHD